MLPASSNMKADGVQPFSHWFLLGAGFALWFIWQMSTALGIFLGTAIPEMSGRWILHSPHIYCNGRTRVEESSHGRGRLSAGLVALLAYSLPYRLGIILAALTGIIVGTILEGRKSSKGDCCEHLAGNDHWRFDHLRDDDSRSFICLAGSRSRKRCAGLCIMSRLRFSPPSSSPNCFIPQAVLIYRLATHAYWLALSQ